MDAPFRLRVLVVDDQPELRKLVRLTLESSRIQVLEADTGISSLDAVRQLKPRIVLMDVMMPGSMDGLQACKMIKDDLRLSDTKVIIMTARGQQVDIKEAKAAGADYYLRKPFSPLELLDTVNRLGQVQ